MSIEFVSERKRIEEVYEKRSKDRQLHQIYSPFDIANLYRLQMLERDLLSILIQHKLTNLSEARVLDVGCGSGSQLLRWINYGVQPANCAGVDLMIDRIENAHRVLPSSVDLRQENASLLSHEDDSFDIVYQFMLLSSVLDANLQKTIAHQMLRVVRPNGVIISYDFWLNPTNSQTVGLSRKKIRQLFSGCKCIFYKITLAPPFARKLVPLSWLAALFLEKTRVLNTHYLTVIFPKNSCAS